MSLMPALPGDQLKYNALVVGNSWMLSVRQMVVSVPRLSVTNGITFTTIESVFTQPWSFNVTV